jgi:hypothetical protein
MTVGVVTKPDLEAARETLVGIDTWLTTHQVASV